MNNPIDLKKYLFKNKHVIIIKDDNNNSWFYGNQIAKILGYERARDAIRSHVQEKYTKTYLEIQQITNNTISIPHASNVSKFINEMGLYQLIMRSKLPKANKIQEYIYENIISSVNKKHDDRLHKNINSLLVLNENIYLQLHKATKLNEHLYALLQKEIKLNDELYNMLLLKNDVKK